MKRVICTGLHIHSDRSSHLYKNMVFMCIAHSSPCAEYKALCMWHTFKKEEGMPIIQGLSLF